MMEEASDIISKDSAEDFEHNSGCPSDINDNPCAPPIESLGVDLENSSSIDLNGENEVMADKARNGKRSRAIFDSDSEDNTSEKEENDQKADDSDGDIFDRIKRAKSGFSRVKITSDSDSGGDDNDDDDDDDVKDNDSTPMTSELKQKSNKISNLIDSESEEDIPQRHDSDPEEQAVPEGKSQKSEKPKNISKRAAKDDALNKIRSETQRLIRESSISLPYHRPKQRTLEDFLNRRKVASALPKAPTMANKLKMSAMIVNQVLKQKEKEAEVFYKSSDSEEEPEEQENKATVSVNPPAPEQISIEDTQKLQKVDVHNRQQIIHNGSLEFGVPRKLFMDGASPPPGLEPSADTLAEKINEEGNNLPHRECKRNLKDASIPRKLFNQDFQQGAGTPEENYEIPTFDSGVGSTTTQESSSELISKASETPKTLEKPLETPGEAPECLKTQISDVDTEKFDDCAISATPMVSNKEFMKLNSRNSVPNTSETTNAPTEERDEAEEADGHTVGLPPPEPEPENDKFNFVTPQSSTTNPIPSLPNIKKGALLNATNSKPKLRGNPGMIIDLTKSSKPDKAAIESLVDRFLTKHSAIPKNEDKDTEVTVLNTEITPDGLKISKETLPYKIRSEKIDDNDLNKPGAKLLKLKEELEKKMASKRHEEWKQKEKEAQESAEDEIDEFEKEEKLMSDEDEGESEPEEDDIVIEDKQRKTHAFDDDEAEVSEEDNIELSEDENEGDYAAETGVEDDDDDDDDGDGHGEEGDMNESKKFTRIIRIEDDSGDENSQPTSPKTTFERTNTDVDIFADEENGIYSIGASQSCKTPSASNQLLSLISPLSESNQLASPRGSVSKNLFTNTQISDFSPFITISTSPKQSSASGELESVNNKLFHQEPSPVNDEDLLDLCSGKFPDGEINTQCSAKPNLKGLVGSSLSPEGITDSQLMNLCSGSFSTQPETTENYASNHQDAADDDDFKFTFHNSDTELEKNSIPHHIQEREIPRNVLDIASSSDEEKEINKNPEDKRTKKLTKKKVQKLVLSDDEDEHQEKEFSSGESDTQVESEEEKFVDYDSEENEVIIVPKKDLKKVAANYLEAEAELSESEWGSEDEDERDLDKYEMEEADTEVIDENLMRDQIGKIHARQLLDEDNRDVRMLKELLFDDGDLHEDGQGRDRKFKWKNIDKLGLEKILGPTDDNDDVLDEEHHDGASELEWRKLRLERQKFIDEKKDSEVDGDLAEGQLFRLGLKALKRNNTTTEQSNASVIKKKSIVPRSVSEFMQCSSKTSHIIHTVSKRGSFLARGDKVLAKFASIPKETETFTLAGKKAGNFVFTSRSPSVTESMEITDGDNDDDETLQKNNKAIRKRKQTAGITPKATKKAKIEMEHSSAKKLF